MLAVHLFLIRHGQVEATQHGRFYGGKDVALSAHGRDQAKWAAEFVAPVHLDQIWASPLQRAHFGAQQVHRQGARTQPIEVVEALREVDRGAWAPYTKSELLGARSGEWESYLADPGRFRAHGGESLDQFSERLDSVWRRICVLAQASNGQSLQLGIVSHLFPTRCLIGKALGLSLSEWMELELETGSVSYLRLRADRWELPWCGHEPRGEDFSQAYPQDFPHLRQI